MTRVNNKEMTEMYLKTRNVSEKTKENERQMFDRMIKYANLMNKHLYDLNYQEAESILYLLRSRSIALLNNALNQLKKYTNWAMSEGYVTQNVYDQFPRAREYYKKYIPTVIKDQRGITKEELDTLIDFNDIYQDKALLLMLYYGVDVDDIPLVRAKDFNYKERTLQIPRGDKVVMNQKDADIFRRTILENRKSPMGSLSKKEYILQRTRTIHNKEVDEPLQRGASYKRFIRATEHTQFKYITPLSVGFIRVIEFLIDYYETKENFERATIEEVEKLVRGNFKSLVFNGHIKPQVQQLNIFDR